MERNYILNHENFLVAVLRIEHFDFQNRNDQSHKRSAQKVWLERSPKSKFFWLSGDGDLHRYCVVLTEKTANSPTDFACAAREFAQAMNFELLAGEKHKKLLERYTVQAFMNG